VVTTAGAEDTVTGGVSGRPTDAIIDLLGALAYGELSAFDHLAEDARMAPTLAARAKLSAVAATEFEHHCRLSDRLGELGATPEDAMAPFVAAVETYHALTEPATWAEAVVKAYVGDGLAADFYREIAAYTDAGTAALISGVLDEGGRGEFAVSEVRRELGERPGEAGRLALFARRLVGEAISQTQHVLADRDSLTALLLAGRQTTVGLPALFARLTERHGERMAALGLGN